MLKITMTIIFFVASTQLSLSASSGSSSDAASSDAYSNSMGTTQNFKKAYQLIMIRELIIIIG